MVAAQSLGRVLCFGLVFATLTLGAGPACAEFPPDGAVADPNNPAIASGVYPMQTRDGVDRKYVFYFDCGVGMWIGVAVASLDQGAMHPGNRLGPGREFPSGPPPGSDRDPSNQNRALNLHTGDTFVFQSGEWKNSATGELIRSPKLCSSAAFSPAPPASKAEKRAGGDKDSQPLFPDAYRSPLATLNPKPTPNTSKLPPRSIYIRDGRSRNFDPSQGPVRISVPLAKRQGGCRALTQRRSVESERRRSDR